MSKCETLVVLAGCYDFVYVPHDKTKERNVALAFVNFTVHAVAQLLRFIFRFVMRSTCLEVSSGFAT